MTTIRHIEIRAWNWNGKDNTRYANGVIEITRQCQKREHIYRIVTELRMRRAINLLEAYTKLRLERWKP